MKKQEIRLPHPSGCGIRGQMTLNLYFCYTIMVRLLNGDGPVARGSRDEVIISAFY